MTLENQLDIAEDHRLAGRYDEAKSAYQLLLVDEYKSKPIYFHALRGIAEVHRMLESYHDAKTYYTDAINGYNAIQHKKGLGYAYLGLGQLNRQQNNTDTAKSNIEDSIRYFNDANDDYGHADAHIELGHFALI